MKFFIPFTWTTPALLAGQKIVIRLNWVEYEKVNIHSGQFVWAYDYPPRSGGKPVAVIHLIGDPLQESTSKLTEQDYLDEGFALLERFPILMPLPAFPIRKFFNQLRSIDFSFWVVRFELMELTPEGRQLAESHFRWGGGTNGGKVLNEHMEKSESY